MNTGTAECIRIIGQLQGMMRVMEWVHDEASCAAAHIVDKSDDEVAWCTDVDRWIGEHKHQIYQLIQRGHTLPGDLLT